MAASLHGDHNSCRGDEPDVQHETVGDAIFPSETQQPARSRALSDLTSQTEGADVGAVVLKAKRAAKSLWMIIHAQNCRSVGSCCPHRGCLDTKKLLLHVKTCAAGPGFVCPDGFNGCLQARKLLSHYRRCREIRARQARQPPAKRLLKQQRHNCLVCSLLARHAKTVLDSGKPAPLRCVVPNKDVQRKDKYETQHNLGKSQRNDEQKLSVSEVVRSVSTHSMPPPPPRLPHRLQNSEEEGNPPLNEVTPPSRLSAALSSVGATPSSSAKESVVVSTPRPAFPLKTDENIPRYHTPPSQSVLLQQRIADVAAATAPSPNGGTTDPSLLGKSFDSSKHSLLLRLDLPKVQVVSEDETCSTVRRGSTGMPQPCGRQRARAESYDAISHSSSSSRMPSIMLSDSPRQGYDNDPTVEATLRSEHESMGLERSTQNVELVQSQHTKQINFGKRRSSSCGVLSSLHACGTIEEDQTYCEKTTSDDEPFFICDDDK